MKHFCTLSDKGYLLRGLALYKSLKQHSSEEFKLHYLCLDQESFNTLETLKLPGLIPWSLQKMEAEREDLRAIRGNRQYNQYCWTLASFFTDFLFDAVNPPHMTYLDSDLFFYADPEIIYKEIGDKHVGIIAHRHNSVGDRDGAYNVAFVYFKNTSIGRSVLTWWKGEVIAKREPYWSIVGDQKYLEEFVPRFGAENICIADKTFAHGAPWNFRLYCYDEYEKTGMVRWGNLRQPLVFNHFSKLSYNLTTGEINPTSGVYLDHTLGGAIFRIPELGRIYANYVSYLIKVNQECLQPTIQAMSQKVQVTSYNQTGGITANKVEINGAPTVLGKMPKLAFGMIVFEGDYVLKQCLEAVYPFASQIMIAEGPVSYWAQQGRTTSTDKTNEILNNFPDPKGIIKVVHRNYNEKDDQCRAYMDFFKGESEYLWNLDSDEIFKAEDIETILKLLRDNQFTSVGVKSCTFYGGFDRYITGFEEMKDQFLRIFRVYPGSTWKTHRPPTIVHSSPIVLESNHLDSDTLYEKYGVKMYHYSYVFPRQVFNKILYYKAAVSRDRCIDDYFNQIYKPWVLGDDATKLQIENKFNGVHEFKPETRSPSFTAKFEGVHPNPIANSIGTLKTEFERQMQMRSYAGI